MFRDNDDVQVTPVASTSKRVRSVACNTEGVRALIDRADPVHAGVLPLRSLGVSQRIVDDFVIQSEVQVSAAGVAADHVTGCHNIRSLGHRYFLRDQRLISGELSRTATALIRDLISDNLLRLLHFGLGVVAVVPIFAAASSLATGNRLALGTLETFQTVRALRVRVALASAALQILGTAAVSAAQVLDAAVQRIVAVVPIFAAAIALASGNLLALGALEALQALRALRIRVAFASARLQVLGTTAVAAAQVLVIRCGDFFALGGARVGVPFRAIATLGFTVHVHALACFVAAAVVFLTWVRLLRGRPWF